MRVVFFLLTSVLIGSVFSISCPTWEASNKVNATLCIQNSISAHEVLVNTAIDNTTEACFIADIFRACNVDDQVAWLVPQNTTANTTTNTTQTNTTSGQNQTVQAFKHGIFTQSTMDLNEDIFHNIEKQPVNKNDNSTVFQQLQNKICLFEKDFYFNKFQCKDFLKIYSSSPKDKLPKLDDWLIKFGNVKPKDKDDGWETCQVDEECESHKCLCTPRVFQDDKKHRGRCMTSVYDDLYEEFFETACFSNGPGTYVKDLCTYRLFIEYGHALKQLDENKKNNYTSGLEIFTDYQVLNKEQLDKQVKEIYKWTDVYKNLQIIAETVAISTLTLVLIIIGSIVACALCVLFICCCFCYAAVKSQDNKDYKRLNA